MKKRIVVCALAVIMLLSFSGCGGGGFKDSMFFNADFSTETVNDSVGKVARSTSEKEVTFEKDEEIGRTVGVFQETAAVNYLIDYSKMADAFTMEAYVKVAKQKAYGLICGTYWYNSKSGVGFGTGVFDLGEGDPVGSRNTLSMFAGHGSITETVKAGESDVWQHLVFVHDGAKDYYYVEGKDVTEGGIDSAATTMQHDASAGFRIGGYNTVGQFCVADMRVAYVRLYEKAASAEDVKTLYEGRNS